MARYPDVAAFQNDLAGLNHVLSGLELTAGQRGKAFSAFCGQERKPLLPGSAVP